MPDNPVWHDMSDVAKERRVQQLEERVNWLEDMLKTLLHAPLSVAVMDPQKVGLLVLTLSKDAGPEQLRRIGEQVYRFVPENVRVLVVPNDVEVSYTEPDTSGAPGARSRRERLGP